MNPIVFEIEYLISYREEEGSDELTVNVVRFHLLGNNLINVTLDAAEMLLEQYGEDGWSITGINALLDINILNLYDYVEGDGGGEEIHPRYRGETDNDKIECPTCAVSHTVLDNIINFECGCGYKFKVSGDIKWNILICPNCQKEIDRRKLSRDKISGKWEYGE